VQPLRAGGADEFNWQPHVVPLTFERFALYPESLAFT
jgi:hypothetical protein